MSTEDKRLKNLRPPWKPGQSGNPRGSNHLQTLRTQLAKLDPVAMNAMRRVLKMPDVDNKTWRFVLRVYLQLRYPEEWREVVHATAVATTQTQSGQPFLARAELSQEDRRAVIEFLAQHLRPKEVSNGATQPQIADDEIETGQPLKELAESKTKHSAAVENGHSGALPPTHSQFGNWK